MWRITVVCAVMAVGACSDSTVAPTPDLRPPGDRTLSEAARNDQGPAREARPSDVPRAADTKPISDAKPPITEAKPPASDAKPGSLQVKLVSASAWANLMPPAAPDPTNVKLTLSFTNSGGQDVTGVKLIDGQLQPVPTGTAQAIELQAQAPFTGVVPAGQTLSADFLRVKKSTSVPLPTTCNGLVKVGFSVQHAAGTVGPLWSGDVSFLCAY